MKSLYHCLILSLLLAAIGCGKENESGKSQGACLQYGMNGQCAQYSNYTGLGSWHSYDLNSLVNRVPCQWGRNAVNGTINTHAVTMQNILYMGVTSNGDVILARGNGTNTVQFNMILCGSQSIGQQSFYFTNGYGQQFPGAYIGGYGSQGCRNTLLLQTSIMSPMGIPLNFRDPNLAPVNGQNVCF